VATETGLTVIKYSNGEIEDLTYEKQCYS